jgi:hypothetical protein
MGYTHYWQIGRPIEPQEWLAITQATHQIIDHAAALGIGVAGWNGEGEPVIGEGEIRLNGADDDNYETFAIIANEPTPFDFCKTGRRPYDAVVGAVLLACRRVLPPDAFALNSDGNWDRDWLAHQDGGVAPVVLFDAATSLPPFAGEPSPIGPLYLEVMS